MGDKCLSIEEMLEFLSSERITDENRARLFQINKHLMKCDDCGKIYRRLTTLYDIVEGWSIYGQYESEQKLHLMRACLSLTKAQKTATPSISRRIETWLKNYVDSSAQIILKIGDNIKLAADKAGLFVVESSNIDFGYANLAAARGEPSKAELDLLIDKNDVSNKIFVDNEQQIKVTLAAVFDVAPLVAVIPRDPSLSAIVIEPIYNNEDNCWIAVFANLPNGEYDLVIEASEG